MPEIDKDAVRRLVAELDALLRRERAIGTSRETIEIVLLHAWELHRPDDKDEQP